MRVGPVHGRVLVDAFRESIAVVRVFLVVWYGCKFGRRVVGGLSVNPIVEPLNGSSFALRVWLVVGVGVAAVVGRLVQNVGHIHHPSHRPPKPNVSLESRNCSLSPESSIYLESRSGDADPRGAPLRRAAGRSRAPNAHPRNLSALETKSHGLEPDHSPLETLRRPVHGRAQTTQSAARTLVKGGRNLRVRNGAGQRMLERKCRG